MGKKTTRYARNRAHGHTPRANHGLAIIKVTNTRLTQAEIQRIIGACKAALAALRQAQGTHTHWVVLCTACHVALAIEDCGVMTGQSQIITAAEHALDAIGARCGDTAAAWQPKACTGPELTALADLVAAHSRQVHELTNGEYTRQFKLAVDRVASGRGLVFHAELSAP